MRPPVDYSRTNSLQRKALLSAVLLLVGVHSSLAQLSISRSSGSSGDVVIEFTYDWDESLTAFVDSAGVRLWSYPLLDVLSGGLIDGSYSLDLPSYLLPEITVLERQYDEVTVDMAPDLEHPGPSQADASARGLGLYKKQPVVEIVAAAFRLDANRSVLRRYRKLVVSVRSTANAPFFSGSFQASKGGVVESVLSRGQIFRISITEDGVYRVDRSFLQSLGLTPDSIDPSDIQIYGNGGRPLPALAGLKRAEDIVELPVVRQGGGDGRFDESDYVLFFASAPSGWLFEDGTFKHFVHPFSNDNAVFLKVGSSGAELGQSNFPPASSAPVFSSTEGRFFVDIEERVWSREHGSGHEWMSNTIRSGGERTIYSDLTLPGLLSGVLQFEARVAIASNPRATVAMIAAGTTLAQRTAPTVTINGAEYSSASVTSFSFTQPVSAGQTLDLSMRLLNQLNEPQAAVDWVTVTYEQALIATKEVLAFSTRPFQSTDQQFLLSGFSSTPRVWDVSDGRMQRAYEVQPSGNNFVIHIPSSQVIVRPRDIIAFTEGSIKPLTASQSQVVANQNLHGIASFPDFVIVASELFLNAANRLANHRRAEGLEVSVVTQKEVFNEFAGGVPDMRAVRDYMKFLYDRAPGPSQMPDYLLLFGDGHYDFRGLSGFPTPLANLIFPYETATSTNTVASYTSDDYFGLLDDDEGIWRFTGITGTTTERVDVGIGRFPVQTPGEAELMVDKVIAYDNPDTFGPWRTTYLAVADDGPTGLTGLDNQYDLHLTNIDQVAQVVTDEVYPEINMRKIYGEAYDRVFLNGFRLPDATRAILEALERGLLLFNYSGHGGPNGLAQEQMFTIDHARALTNGDKLPVFITATCSFGWWDLEGEQSAGEELLLNPDGGAIAVLTAVRLAYTSSSPTSLNAGLNRALNQHLFMPDSDNLPKRLGDALRETKNTDVGLQGNSRKFNLLGDPSMRIGLPAGKAVVTKLLQTNLGTDTGQMKALDRVTIEGQVLTVSGALDAGFNGTVNVTVFDAERRVPILENRYHPVDYFRQREDLIWRGDVQVTSGQFTAEFVVPKDISYSDLPGRISVYASNDQVQATGYSQNFLVGGTSDNPPNDDVGPEISLFLNNTAFVDGGSVESNPELIVQLFDESGINTVGAGVGHEMLLLIDEQDQSAQDIGSAFVADENSFQRGEIRWNITDLEPGPHSLSVRAWDVLNNSNSANLSFTIANDEVLNVHNVYNYPNPMNRETRFIFEHNQPSGTPAEVQIRIFTLSGRLIRTIRTAEALPEGVLGSGPLQVYWDGRDDDLDRPATGVYLYRIRIAVEQTNGERQVSEHVEKLVIIR